MLHAIRLALTVAMVATLAACASGVKRMEDANAPASAKVERNVKSVNLWLNDDAKKLVADNEIFNEGNLRETVERTLQAQSLVKFDATQTLHIEITSFRVRSMMAAVIFGFLVGDDNVEGIVTVKNSGGVVVKQGKVSASYALGGLAGAVDSMRMGWLYEEFAKHTAAELTDVAAK
jgi:hypothetical protein